ncbi:MAG TPA: DUF2723 domain-containing protein [Candidatus Cloacimonadota bacterium]|nr:DUF2723 domain-containing protein [Candidatus Cloacimonadota bacterium]
MSSAKGPVKQRILEQAHKNKGQTGTAYKKPEPRPALDDSIYRPQVIIAPKTNMMIAWIIFAASLLVYLLTQARTLSFWDSGEYATCMSILGVPHPPGNPFYIVFGRAVIALFGGLVSHAVLAAFISGITSAFAVMLTYLVTVQLVSMLKVKAWEAGFAGAMAALLTAFSFTFWMNAVEAEVYAGLSLFVNLIIWLTLRWVQNSRDMDHQNVLLLIIYLFFLGFCVHQTALQIAPAILFIVIYPLFRDGTAKASFWPKVVGYTVAIIMGYVIFGAIGAGMKVDDFDKWGFAVVVLVLLWVELRDVIDPRVWLLAFGLVIAGVSSHLYLAVRAADRPFINEGHPSSWNMFMDYVLRKQYGETSFFDRRGSFFSDQMGFHFMRYIGWQWFNVETLTRWFSVPANVFKATGSMIVGVLGLFGAFFHARGNKHSFYYFLSIILCTTVLMVFVMNISDSEVRDRDYFFVVGYNMWAIWMGIGAMGILWILKSQAAKIALAIILGTLPLINLATQYHVHDRSREFVALDYGINFLNSLEENAIIFTNGDNDTFPIWYAQAVQDPHAVEHMHPAKDVYPDQASQAAVKQAMEYKNKYLKGIRKDVTVANLSLLNTPWYVRQLRDKEGVLFSWSDEEITNLIEIPVPDTLRVSAGAVNPQMSFKVAYEETPAWRPRENGYRISDVAVMRIIQDNFGKRPIYFAVTCESMIGFDDYVRTEGMVNRVVHTKAGEEQQLDIVRLTQNIDTVYKYRSIKDPRVYKDENMNRLIMNYAAAFANAGSYYAMNKDFKKAWSYASKARDFVVDDLRMIDFYVRYYAGQGQWDKLDNYINRYVFTHTDGAGIYLRYIMGYLNRFDPQMAIKYYEKALRQYPEETLVAQFAVYFAEDYSMREPTAIMLERVRDALAYPVDEYLGYLRQTPQPQ